nr:CCHC-type zinc finger protein CG3800-like [Halyomorpha halys]
MAEERRPSNSTEETDTPVGFKTNVRRNWRTTPEKRKCFSCSKEGHLSKNCATKKKPCGVCKKTNHQEKDCFFCKNRTSVVSFHAEDCSESSTEWDLDSGSAKRMTNNITVLSQTQPIDAEVGLA